MRVIYLINSLKNGGPVNMLYTLVKYITKDVDRVIVIALKPAPENNMRDFSDLNCKVIVLPRNSLKETVNQVQKIISDEQADIVHSHGGVADMVNSHLLGNHMSFSTVHCDPDADFSMKLGKVRGWLKATAFIHTMKKIQYPVACSETVANKLYEKRKVKIGFVRNGIDLEKITQGLSNVSRQSLGITENAIVLVFCGYLSKRKNVKFICDAFKNVERHDINLIVLGDGEQLEYVKDCSKVDNRIKAIGRISNVYDYLQISDIFVSASLSEGLPLAVMEGMACGLPALLSDIDSHMEIKCCCTEGIDLFGLNDSCELGNLINNLNKDVIKVKGSFAKKNILNYLNADRMGKDYYKLYRELVN